MNDTHDTTPTTDEIEHNPDDRIELRFFYIQPVSVTVEVRRDELEATLEEIRRAGTYKDRLGDRFAELKGNAREALDTKLKRARRFGKGSGVADVSDVVFSDEPILEDVDGWKA